MTFPFQNILGHQLQLEPLVRAGLFFLLTSFAV